MLTPQMFNAKGDGVSDDLAAFKSLAAACAQNGSAVVDIPNGEYYISDSISFDCDNIEFILHAGAHIFCKAATSLGHTLGFIGYLGSGTSTSPVRSVVKISGQGKVTGWRGDGVNKNNENAIGIVRYATVIVDGTVTEAGNKGITAQYGIASATIRSAVVLGSNYRGISIEDQGSDTSVYISNCSIGQTGDMAILASGTRVVIENVQSSSANVNNLSASNGAVHINTTRTLRYVKAHDVKIVEANSAKGLVLSGAKAGDIDRIYVDHSAGNAVEAYNCGSINAGIIVAPSSPNAIAATGSTPAIRKLYP